MKLVTPFVSIVSLIDLQNGWGEGGGLCHRNKAATVCSVAPGNKTTSCYRFTRQSHYQSAAGRPIEHRLRQKRLVEFWSLFFLGGGGGGHAGTNGWDREGEGRRRESRGNGGVGGGRRAEKGGGEKSMTMKHA